MKKKLLSLMLASALALGVAGGLSACTPEPAPEVTGITIDSLVEKNVEKIELSPDSHFGLQVSFTPGGSESNITWTSSDPKIAIVNGGYVTAVNTGTATITATTENGKSDTCQIVVGEWEKYYVVGDKGTVVGGSAIAWDGGAAAADKDATKAFKQDSKDPHKWTLTIDLEKGAQFKITRFNGGWDPAIGASDADKATDITVKATGTKINFVDKNNAPNIAVEDAGRYTFTLQLKQGGAVVSLTYVRDGDIPAAA